MQILLKLASPDFTALTFFIISLVATGLFAYDHNGKMLELFKGELKYKIIFSLKVFTNTTNSKMALKVFKCFLLMKNRR